MELEKAVSLRLAFFRLAWSDDDCLLESWSIKHRLEVSNKVALSSRVANNRTSYTCWC